MVENNLTRAEIINLLHCEKAILRNKFGVISIGLFGSYVKNTNTKDSDVDLFVEFSQPRFEWIAGLQIYLEEKFGKRVEIVRKGAHLSKRFVNLVEKDIHYV